MDALRSTSGETGDRVRSLIHTILHPVGYQRGMLELMRSLEDIQKAGALHHSPVLVLIGKNGREVRDGIYDADSEDDAADSHTMSTVADELTIMMVRMSLISAVASQVGGADRGETGNRVLKPWFFFCFFCVLSLIRMRFIFCFCALLRATTSSRRALLRRCQHTAGWNCFCNISSYYAAASSVFIRQCLVIVRISRGWTLNVCRCGGFCCPYP